MNDFLDIWLMAKCYFTISTGLGLDSVADIFRRPIVFVNYVPVMDMVAWGPYITVPKKLTWSSSNRPLTLVEQVHHTSVNGHYFRDNGIQIHDLSPTDIQNAVLEMEARLTGSWLGRSNEENLNVRFWKQLRQFPQFHDYHSWIHPDARLGTDYLKESEPWLLSM